MAIFDRFRSRASGGEKRKSFPSAAGAQAYSGLEEAAALAKELHPEDSRTVEDFMWSLKAACRARRKQAMEEGLEPMRAEARFFLSKDRLAAYACLLPPENGGEELTLEDFLGDMHYEGIVHGVLEEVVAREFARGYYRIFLAARGTPPQAGEDGRAVELFQRRRHMRLEVQSGSQVAFGQDVQFQPIRKGTVICRILPPKPGKDGMDVTGTALPCPPPVSAQVPCGENIRRDGLALKADADGILYIENDRFCIHEQKIIDGDLDQFQGALRVSGNLYIGGNVDGGVEVSASGDIVINGRMGRARVASGEGTIRVQQGVFGTAGETFLSAAGQVQSPVLEEAEVEAGASVIAETISGSAIRCGGTVYAMTGRGLIANSRIQAQESILCLRAGNIAGGRSRFSVGYPPQVLTDWERIKTELAQAQATIERLWEPILELRRKGSRLSEREKTLLEQLAEQRSLYLKRQEELKNELRDVNRALDKKSKGRIRCEKLYPLLEVQIGRLTEEVATVEEKCNIHVDEGAIHLE